MTRTMTVDLGSKLRAYQENKRKYWLDLACHNLKHEQNAAANLLAEMKSIPKRNRENLVEKIKHPGFISFILF